jgi:hypothetical protein
MFQKQLQDFALFFPRSDQIRCFKNLTSKTDISPFIRSEVRVIRCRRNSSLEHKFHLGGMIISEQKLGRVSP